MKDLVSIIIPTYKRKELFKRALNSLINQTYKNIEIIVVDDNSEILECRNYIENLLSTYSDKRLIYIKNYKNLGGALSRNVGIQNSKGKYISFLDDDDEYDLKKIELQYNFYKNKFKNDEGIVYSQSVIIDKNNKIINSTKIYIEGNKNALNYMMAGNLATTGNWFIPKNCLEEINGFKKLDCGQEWYVIFNILLKGYECSYMKDILLKYYEHNQERITTNYYKKYTGENSLYNIKKQYMDLFTTEEQAILHYKINIMLAGYATNISNKNVRYHINEAKKYKKLIIGDMIKIILKIYLNENQYNILKKFLK